MSDKAYINYHVSVASMQANWFIRYSERQFEKKAKQHGKS